MSLDQHSLFGPAVRFLKSLPFLTVILLAIPFVAPELTRWFVEPLLPAANYVKEDPSTNNKDLHQKLASALQEVQHYKDLLTTLQAMGIEKSDFKPLVLAKNLGHSPQLYRRGLVLSLNHKEKINIQGSAVIYQNCLVGLVDHVRNNWCHVNLIADPEFKIAVDIVSHNQKTAPVEGWPRGICGGQITVSKGSEVIIRHIDNSRIGDIQVGDYVVTSGFDFKVQKGLLIGRVKDIVKGDLFLHLPLKLEINPRDKSVFSILAPVPNPFLTVESGQ